MNRMSLSRVLASTHRWAAAADTRMHSWMAFVLDQKQLFVLTCTAVACCSCCMLLLLLLTLLAKYRGRQKAEKYRIYY